MRDRLTIGTLVCVLGGAGLLAALNLLTAPASALHVPGFVISLVGKYLCYAILALAIDLVWGYAGILTLGHAAFFALGGYCMGMYLMREIGARGVYANPILPDFMVFIGWKELPWYWYGFNHFWFALPMAMIVSGALAFAFGWLAFRSRVSGVYLSIITQALTYALLLAFFRNDMGFGGNNGMTDFKDIVGIPLNRNSASVGLMMVTAAVLAAAFLLARVMTRSRFGKVLIAVRDAESRTRFLGYRPETYKLVVWVVSAMIAGIGGALYVPQV
ncbi:MAG: urea ABC transporter permease subunit UrtC, partial [Stellaceae bacterium]